VNREQRQQQQRQRHDQIKAQQQQRKEQQQKARHDRDQQRQDRQKAQQQQRQDRQDRQKAQQQQRQDQRQGQQQQRQDRQKAQQQQRQDRQKQRQANQRDRQQKKIDNRIARDKARQDRVKQRADRRQADKAADLKRAKDRADRRINNKISRNAARNGRFAARFANRNFARVRFARWAPDRAWRRGLLAAFVPWGIGLGIGGAVFWPYAYADMFNYTFWPSGYYGGYWAYAYDDFFDGIWWAGEPSYVSEALPYQPVSPAPPVSGSAGQRPQFQSQVQSQSQSQVQSQVQSQPASQDRPQTAATSGEGACGETGRGVTAWPFDRMQASLQLSDDQQDLMSTLRDAAVEAADAMRESCPRTQPRSPLERLQAMTERLEATLEALKIVGPPLEKFYDSLSSDQRRRFDDLGPKIADPDAQRAARPGQGSACGEDKPGLANFPIEKIQESVSPTDDQLDLLDKLEDATFKAVDIMKAACPDDPPVSPSARLAATQTRVEAMIEAAKVLQPALEDFYTALSDQQKARFNNMKS
jgi:hypothetical protein